MVPGNNRTRIDILVSPWFIVGLATLLLNDFFLKQSFPSALSGKLSDFAGLFIFPLFWVALFPRKTASTYVLTAVLFIFWKSAYSQTLIDGWNSFSVFPVARTVDYTDLTALLVLPLSYGYSLRSSTVQRSRVALYCIAFVSIFAFIATSFSHKTPYDNEYSFPISRQELLERMSRLPKRDVNNGFWRADNFEVGYSCAEAIISVTQRDTQTVVTLKEINYRCPSPGSKEEMLEVFEKEFINKLKETSVAGSSQLEFIWGQLSNMSPSPTPQKPGTKKSP